LDVVRRPDERQRDQIHPQGQGEPQIVGVLVGQRGDADRHVRQRDALVVGDRPTLDDQADDVLAGPYVLHLDGDPTIVDQQAVTGAYFLGQFAVRTGNAVRCTHDVFIRDGHRVAGPPLHRAVRERPQADLGSLQVSQYSDGPPGGRRGVAHHAVHLLVL